MHSFLLKDNEGDVKKTDFCDVLKEFSENEPVVSKCGYLRTQP